MKESLKLKKRQKLRNNEYYTMQVIQDDFYAKSKKGYKFTNLVGVISSKENILLAYRNIKRNSGSKTAGTDGKTLKVFSNMEQDKFIEYFQKKIKNYFPKSVRRVEIPKPNGSIRPLGIPCIEDRIIQQCIKQILEPICEAKFHNHSYGFRPNRSTRDAIGRSMYLMNKSKLHYVVDIDIKGFFDNVNHSKLKKQMWNLGIQDKNLISIIGKILKSEIKGVGIPNKGTPQGGIISPLLSNIVLNELDWWISDQWETFETKYNYNKIRGNEFKRIDQSHKYRALRRTKMKEIYIVRYADDFKIFCRDYKSAIKIYNAVRLWIKERLGLEISPEKSKITNLRKHYTEFLGIKMKVRPKGKKMVCKSKMSEKSKRQFIEKLRKQIKIIEKSNDPKEVSRLNSIILGSHNYFSCASEISKDMGKIDFLVTRIIYNRLRRKCSNNPVKSKTFERLYGKYKGKTYTIYHRTIFPIYGCTNVPAKSFNQRICNYTEEGRKFIHDRLGGYEYLIEYLLKYGNDKGETELEDNKLSLIAGQNGKCYVTGNKLEIQNMECHHKIPREKGGSNAYKNLVWLNYDVHKLVHCSKVDTINKYLTKLNLDKRGLKKVNTLRKLVGNSLI